MDAREVLDRVDGAYRYAWLGLAVQLGTIVVSTVGNQLLALVLGAAIGLYAGIRAVVGVARCGRFGLEVGFRPIFAIVVGVLTTLVAGGAAHAVWLM